jgi:hypothetical protein
MSPHNSARHPTLSDPAGRFARVSAQSRYAEVCLGPEVESSR